MSRTETTTTQNETRSAATKLSFWQELSSHAVSIIFLIVVCVAQWAFEEPKNDIVYFGMFMVGFWNPVFKIRVIAYTATVIIALMQIAFIHNYFGQLG